MEDLDIAAITKRSIHGVFALVTRTFIVQAIAFTTNFLLTIYLSPSIFGVWFIVTAIIAFLTYFSDIGLAAALIQKKEDITQEDLRTTFTIQQVLVITVVVIALFVSPIVGKFYHLEQEGIFLFQALVISFFLSSLKTIPSIILERNLRFEKIVIPEIVETLFFNSIALVLAVKGFGITSFTIAVLVRGIVGVITIYIIAPWQIGFGFSMKEAKRLLSFGIPFQLNSFIALIKDDLMVAYIGKILPLAQVGYVGFAQKWSLAPLQLIMENIVRITFPSYARLQHDTDNLVKAIEKSLFALTLIIFPTLVGLVCLAPLFVHLIPKYQKWEPALLSLGLFAINAGLSTISTPLTNALNAIGRIKTSLYLMVMWTILTWGLTPLFIWLFGFNGVAGASALISCTVIVVIIVARKYIPFSVSHLITPTIAAIVMAIALQIVLHILPSTLISLILLVVLGGLVYFGVTIALAREEVFNDLLLIKKQFIK
jgi:O-antigen/teichoic acid export membrane protein